MIQFSFIAGAVVSYILVSLIFGELFPVFSIVTIVVVFIGGILGVFVASFLADMKK